jgi:hypothetical protein
MALPNDIWIGYDIAAGLPGPESLQRSELMAGKSIVLGDNKQWCVPRACEFDQDLNRNCTLPRTLQINCDGKWYLGDVTPPYSQLWRYLNEYLEAAATAINGQFVFEGINDWCSLALQTNYFVGPSEVSILALLNAQTRSKIIDVMMDLEAFDTILQKKRAAQGIGNTFNGLSVSTTDSDQNTGQPSPTGNSTT